jgi:hypothetical protein
VVVIVVLVVAAAAAVAIGLATHRISTGAGSSAHPAAADVTLTGCTLNNFGVPVASGSLTNHSSKKSDYSFSLSFLGPQGESQASGSDSETGVASGQTVKWKVTGNALAKGKPTCKVTDVTRYASSTP